MSRVSFGLVMIFHNLYLVKKDLVVVSVGCF